MTTSTPLKNVSSLICAGKFAQKFSKQVLNDLSALGKVSINAGDPSSHTPVADGDICFDTTNSDVYISCAGTYTLMIT